jgi:FAD/FMN-containing dehydrogenase
VRPDLSALRSTFRGPIVTPSDPGYESARVLFNTRVRTRPAVLCRCEDTDDVVTAVRFAREAKLPVAVRGGGHHASGFSLVDGGVVIDVGGLKQVDFDPATATAVVGAGCGWRDLDRVTYVDVAVDGERGLPHGYAGPGGDCPTVSNAGYSMGGGYGLLSRRFGLGCDHILEAELVDAEGRVLRVAEDGHPDLFWALRGAGGAGFGVVTKLEYRLDAVPKSVVGGVMGWPIEQAQDVMRAYRLLPGAGFRRRRARHHCGPVPAVAVGLFDGPLRPARRRRHRPRTGGRYRVRAPRPAVLHLRHLVVGTR